MKTKLYGLIVIAFVFLLLAVTCRVVHGQSNTCNNGDALVVNTGGSKNNQCIPLNQQPAGTGTTMIVANEGVTGTTANRLAKLTGAPSTAVVTATTDTENAIGIVTAGAGTTGDATITILGQASCEFDNATTAGDYFTISAITAGKCHDAGSSYPTSGATYGRVLSTNGAPGTFVVELMTPDIAFQNAGNGKSKPGGSNLDYQFNDSNQFAGAGLKQEDANTIAQRNSTNLQAFNLYGIFTNVNNWERLALRWTTNEANILVENLGTGSRRRLNLGGNFIDFQVGNAVLNGKWRIDTSGHFIALNNNANDIGDSGNFNRPRSIYAGTSFVGPTFTGGVYQTASNCSDSAGAAACGSAAAGSVVIDAGSTSVVVSTTAVTANSQIFVQYDSSLGTRLSVTCNTTPALPAVTARTAATSFTITVPAAPVTNPACYSYFIVN